MSEVPSEINWIITELTKAVKFCGGVWMIWGLVNLATSIKDSHGISLHNGIWRILGGAMIIAAADIKVSSGTIASTVINSLQNAVKAGGSVWLVCGAIVLAGGLKDHNGPGIQSGVWHVIGGVLTISAAVLVKYLKL